MLEVEGVCKTYDVKGQKVVALKDVSFRANEGEILGIIGKSGGGKSTLMRILRGIEDFDAGRIVMDGLEITPESDEEIRRSSARSLPYISSANSASGPSLR